MSSSPHEPLPEDASSHDKWRYRIWGRLAEPSAITAAQVVQFLLAGAAGILLCCGGFPYLLATILGPVAIGVGAVLGVGGLIGAWATYNGMWWLERIALLLVGLGWGLLVPSFIYVPLRMPLRLFFLVLIGIALLDIYKRYRRIDWAYLDPTK